MGLGDKGVERVQRRDRRANHALDSGNEVVLDGHKLVCGNVKAEVQHAKHVHFQMSQLSGRESTNLGVVVKVVAEVIVILAGEHDGRDEKTMNSEACESHVGVAADDNIEIVVGGDQTGLGTEDVFGDAGNVIANRDRRRLERVKDGHGVLRGGRDHVVAGDAGLQNAS